MSPKVTSKFPKLLYQPGRVKNFLIFLFHLCTWTNPPPPNFTFQISGTWKKKYLIGI
jgi:hypothetical protein